MNVSVNRDRRWPARGHHRAGIMLFECIVYLSLLVLLLGVAYYAFDRFTDRSIALRRNADDIARALHAGERWRADLRGATGRIRVETNPNGSLLLIPGPRGVVAYQSTTNAVLRRVGLGAWSTMLDRVKTSSMADDPRASVTAWRWELELQPHSKKPIRVRPLFTFFGVPQRSASP